MPFKIRKMPNKPLYKAYSNGKPLSKKGISKKMAEKQIIALRLSDLKGKP